MRKFQNILFSTMLALIASFTAIYVYTNFIAKPKIITVTETRPVQFASFNNGSPDLTFAAEGSVKAVVHIQTQVQQQRGYSSGNPLFDFFFGNPYQQQEPRMQQATGSGVIISSTGFIVTNNHVIEGANQINIILNDRREFKAKVIGTDPNTDIALLKVEAEDLPFLNWGNSDELKLGEWVLAVGNPFNLTSTVTAGIVSAKARGIGIIGGQLPIESFIQTDAAVNPGNSGGALVNTKGELVGINTAIASRTGSYSGYSFAVPVSIVRKIVEDLKQYGEVQRAVMGILIETMNAELAKELNLNMVSGVYVNEVTDDGAAKIAGIESGDVIIAINDVKVSTKSELQEQISRYRPGDSVKVLVNRKNKEKLFNVTLRNTSGGTGIVKSNGTLLGAELAKISEETRSNLNIRGGIEVTELSEGKFKKAGIKKGYIITSVNKRPVNSVEDLREILKNVEGGVFVEGVYKNGERAYYVFGLE